MIREYQFGDTSQLSEHFKASEFQCKCGKPHKFMISDELVVNLEKLRSELGCNGVHVSSGFRCPEHDKKVGGKGNGKHTQGLAADVICYAQPGLPISSKVVSCKAQDIGFTGIANITSAYTSTHLDMREGKKWYGDETRGTAWGCSDLHEYYGIPKEETNRDIKKGDKGEDVELMQARLHALGYLRASEIDGSFGRITLGAVCAYQLEHGLDVDGICGPKTQAALTE